jgi:hypothetical protein
MTDDECWFCCLTINLDGLSQCVVGRPVWSFSVFVDGLLECRYRPRKKLMLANLRRHYSLKWGVFRRKMTKSFGKLR